MSLDGYLDAHGGDGALHDKLFIIVCSTYNGEPPDNARRFVSHLSQASVTAKELKFAMVGVGNSMWAATFHKVPKGIVSKLDALGGEALLEHAYLDVSTSSWTEDWEVSLRACVCVRVRACACMCACVRIRSIVLSPTNIGRGIHPSALQHGALAVHSGCDRGNAQAGDDEGGACAAKARIVRAGEGVEGGGGHGSSAHGRLRGGTSKSQDEEAASGVQSRAAIPRQQAEHAGDRSQ